jgi:hypothetical protein
MGSLMIREQGSCIIAWHHINTYVQRDPCIFPPPTLAGKLSEVRGQHYSEPLKSGCLVLYQ